MCRCLVRWLVGSLLTLWFVTVLSMGAGVALADESSGVDAGSGADSEAAREPAGVQRAREQDESSRATGAERQRRTTSSRPDTADSVTAEPEGAVDRGVTTRIAARTARTGNEDPASEAPAAASLRSVAQVAPPVASEARLVAAVDAEPVPATTAAMRPASGPTLINAVGTLFFSVFDLTVRFFEGPPSVPANSTVRVSRRTLDIEGTVVDADWYFPTLTEPDKLIYFQHGGFARAGVYNATAADLAEDNNAIVVAPSITTNFFAYDGRAMSGDPMHAAVARLFLGDRAALTASARLAGWEGELPQRFVIAGHSAGGQLAAGAAGWYTQFASDEDDHDLAGVLLLETSHLAPAVERAIRKVPGDIPVYMLNGEPGPLNSYSGLEYVLADARPGFIGVRLIGGTHNDAWQTTNALGALLVGLGVGFPQPQNVEAAQILMNGWISDWFEGTHTGYYGERGQIITIDTPAGPAEGYAIPGPPPELSFVDQIVKALFESTTLLAPFSVGPPVETTQWPVRI